MHFCGNLRRIQPLTDHDGGARSADARSVETAIVDLVGCRVVLVGLDVLEDAHLGSEEEDSFCRKIEGGSSLRIALRRKEEEEDPRLFDFLQVSFSGDKSQAELRPGSFFFFCEWADLLRRDSRGQTGERISSSGLR